MRLISTTGHNPFYSKFGRTTDSKIEGQTQTTISSHFLILIIFIIIISFPSSFFSFSSCYCPHLQGSQMNQKTLKSLCFPLFHSYIIIIILFSLLTRTTLCSIDPKFEACVPKTCGNNQTISYPFYIKGKQEPFCGNPDFEITCGSGTNNGFPILTLYGNQYIIHEIDYNNHSLRVSNAAFSRSSSEQCIARTQNLTFGVHRFTFGSNRNDLLLFYDCDLTSLPEGMKQNRIGCSAENKTGSVLGLDKEDPNLGLAWKNCYGGVVNATVEDERGGIEGALRRGFVLNWKASNCSECSNSGGRCGFDPDPAIYNLRCYCPDKVHRVKCNPHPG